MNDLLSQPSPPPIPPSSPTSDGGFTALVDQFYQPLYRFALGLTHDASLASDLTQQTFYVWARHGHQLRDPQKAKGWLYTTLYREFLREVRRKSHAAEVELNEGLIETPALERSGPAAVDGATAMRVLQRVAEPFRAPLLLFYVEDFSYEEIARTLGIPLGTVMSRLSRGRAELRARFHAGGELPMRPTAKQPPLCFTGPPPRARGGQANRQPSPFAV